MMTNFDMIGALNLATKELGESASVKIHNGQFAPVIIVSAMKNDKMVSISFELDLVLLKQNNRYSSMMLKSTLEDSISKVKNVMDEQNIHY